MRSSRFVRSYLSIVAAVASLAACAPSPQPARSGAEPDDAPSGTSPASIGDEAEIRQAIQTFLDDPEQGEPGKIMRFVSESKDVLVVFRQSLLEAEGASDDMDALMLAAFAAGNARAQLDAGKKEDMPVAGVKGMVAVYKKVLAANGKLRVPKLDEYVARDADGSLERFVAELVAQEKK